MYNAVGKAPMPQLDLYMFFGLFFSFTLFFVGMFVFCAYVIPFLTYISKVTSDRIYLYFVAIIQLGNNSTDIVFEEYYFYASEYLY